MRGFAGDSAGSDLSRSIDIYRFPRRLPTASTCVRVCRGSARDGPASNAVTHCPESIFRPFFLPSRCRMGGVVESHHRDRSTRTSRRTIWRGQIDLKHSRRALQQQTLTVHCGLGRCCVRSRRSQTAAVSITSMKRPALNPSGYRVQAYLLVSASRDWSAT